MREPQGTSAPRRRILYGRRRGRRLRSGQRELFARLLPALDIRLTLGEPVAPAALFSSKVDDIWLEIGFGGGEHLAWQASRNPGIGMIGCEPFVNGVARLLAEIEARSIGNIRLFRDDARLLLAELPEASIGRVFILFPDPWPKARHHKRRIVSGPVLSHLARIMRDGSELRMATDDPGYLEWILDHVDGHEAFTEVSGADRGNRTADWPPTRYERKAAAAGRASAFLRYARRPRRPS